MGEDDSAKARLQLLQQEFTTPGQGAPAVRSRPQAEPGDPVRLAIIDHMAASVDEVITHTRAVAPDAGPVPARPHDIYDWAVRATPDLDDDRRHSRDAMIYRQGLEHAIAMGDTKVVRPHPCPGCRCVGLFWDTVRRRAVCVNRYCAGKSGASRTWTLRELADAHIERKESRRLRAT
ncbi:hypothetical protein ACPB9J_33345 [Streptomyces lavendulocolor]|uniref:hypothetical protein n=1 Tax=Streptomyces lavendulocolor TaxID=67316 RepID=UPI003C2AD986